jgi:hypothetical protein
MISLDSVRGNKDYLITELIRTQPIQGIFTNVIVIIDLIFSYQYEEEKNNCAQKNGGMNGSQDTSSSQSGFGTAKTDPAYLEPGIQTSRCRVGYLDNARERGCGTIRTRGG